MSRISTLTSIMLLATLLSFSTETPAADNAVSKDTAPGEIPGLDRIKADASRHFVYTHEGLPVIMALASSPSVFDATINSSVRKGNQLTLNVTLLFTDLNPKEKGNSLAQSRMTYQETDGVWELLVMEQNSIRDVGSLPQGSEDDC